MKRHYIFGQPVLPVKPVANGPRQLFVLGAYPSALHARWLGPDGTCLIQAVAVDNEPEPFWTGHDEECRVKQWKKANFRSEWGDVECLGRLNGSSGRWVQEQILDVLEFDRDSAWVTDCLDTYSESVSATHRLESDKIATVVRTLGIPFRLHNCHPSESDIVRLALDGHRQRLLAELKTAQPGLIVTLGNAALRVFKALAQDVSAPLQKLSPEGYGTRIFATIESRQVEWLPLAHPAAPSAYQAAHRKWIEACRSSTQQPLPVSN